MGPVSAASRFHSWLIPSQERVQNQETAKVEDTASAFFSSLQIIFYGEKVMIPHAFLPFTENAFSTLSAIGYLFAVASIAVSGFGAPIVVIIILSTAIFVAAGVVAQATILDSLSQSAEKFKTENERLHAEVDRLSLQNDRLEKTAASLEKTSEDLKKTNEDLQNTNKDLQQTNADLQYTNQCLTFQVDRFSEENNKLAHQVSLMAYHNARLASEVQNLAKQVELFSSQNEELKSSLTRFHTQIEAFEQQNVLSLRIAKEHEEQMAVLLAKNQAQTDLNCSLLQTMVSQMESSQREFHELCLSSKQEQALLVQNLSSELASVLNSSELVNRIKELRAINSSIHEATASLQSIQAKVEKAANTLGEYEGRCKAYEESLKERDAMFRVVTDRLTEVLKQVADNTDRQTELTQLLSPLLEFCNKSVL